MSMLRSFSLGLFLAALAALAAGAPAHADPATATTRAWMNCQGGEGIWPEMRISGCSEVIKSGKESGTNLATAYYNRGNAHLQKSEYRKAIDDFTQALKFDGDNANALHERCWARAVLAIDLEDALSDCNKSLRVRPNDAETLGGRGFVYLRLGFYRTAILDYDAALEFKPDTPEFLFARGLAKAEAGDDAGAHADFEAARALEAKIAERFERYDALAEGRGVWGTLIGYWRSVMRWLY
jgi:tetratricopeptide (TPR) repeat protein